MSRWSGPSGAVSLFHARANTVEFIDATISNDSGPAIMAERIDITHAFLCASTTLTGSGELSALRLNGATIGGQALFRDLTVTNASGTAISAEGAVVAGSLFLCPNVVATGAGSEGAVRLTGARIGGFTDADAAVLRNDSGPAFEALATEFGNGLHLREGFTATGAGGFGAVNLDNAVVNGPLECTDARLTNETGPAFTAHLLRVGGNLRLNDTIAAGAILLTDAHVGGVLNLWGATVGNTSGAAFDARKITVDRDLILRGGFTASGDGKMAAVLLTRARVHGQVAFDGSSAVNPSGPTFCEPIVSTRS